MKTRPFLLVLLILLTLHAATHPVNAQSSATIVRRLTDLETQMTAVLARVNALEGENTAKTAQLASQASRIADLETQVVALQNTAVSHAATIAALQSGLAQEILDRQAGDNDLNATLHQYVETLTASTLVSAKAYADTKDADTLAAAKTYADGKDATTLAAAKTYADTKSATTLSQANTYTDGQLAPIADKLIHFSRSGNEVYITGANVHIRNGLGHTYLQLNGLGNLIIGYNELRNNGSPNVRTGSHNLLLGFGNNFSSAGGIVNGAYNSSEDFFSSILGGSGNTSSGLYSVVSGGFNNVASGDWSTIGGGANQTASGAISHVP